MATTTPQTRGWIAVVKRWRRRSRTILNQLLTRVVGTPESKRAPLDGDTRRILVVRVNKRLGNILFLTPMLHALNKGLPEAQIDVLIRGPEQQPLLASLPGVRHVYVQPQSVRQLLALKRRLRQERYDLAVDPSVNSTGDRVALALAGARQRLGFAGPGQWSRLTHAARPAADPHQARRAVALLGDAIEGVDFGHWPYLAVHSTAAACADAERRWRRALGAQVDGPVIGFFAQATGGKQLDTAWWQTWLAAVREQAPHARVVQIQPPGASTALEPDLPTMQVEALDVLAALLGRLNVFVAADSGPMHLAAAAGAPTIGLFKATDVASYAPLGAHCGALGPQELTPEQVLQATLARLPQA